MADKGSFVNWAELYATQPSLAADGLSSGDTCTVAGVPLTWTLEAGVYWWHSDESGDPSPGSPAAPFTSEAQRTAWATENLASLLPGRTTAWGPGNVESVWNGPLATDWIQGPDGPVAVEYEGIFANKAALDTAIPTGTPGHFATTEDGKLFVWSSV